jgi:16S rRNA G966 N2-methylase RsmD
MLFCIWKNLNNSSHPSSTSSSVLSKGGVNWVGIEALSRGGANWTGIDTLSRGGVNWTGIEALSRGGANWTGIDADPAASLLPGRSGEALS